jgi:alpha-N-arabinofuranosidase
MAVAAMLGAAGLMANAPAPAAAGPAVVSMTLHADRPGATIAPNIYGQFAEHLGHGIYGGVWVGLDSPIPNTQGFRNDVIAALRRIHVPVIRWPGGCFADDYNWRDGIGPPVTRPVRINKLWGGVEESNAVGTHEYMALAELIGARTYVSSNVGSDSARATAQWLEYMTSATGSSLAQERRHNGRELPFTLNFIGVGNEPWGCGGQMRVEHYVDLFRNYAEFLRVPAGQALVKVAAGSNSDDYHWTEALMAGGGPAMDALSVHYYTIASGDWNHKGPATGFDEALWIGALAQTLRMDEIISRHSAIMDRYDPARRVSLFVDEWGNWTDPEPGSNPGFLYQQNTLRDALVAALNLNIFHAHAERVRMANIAQMVNVLQAMVLTDHEQMVLTPTYHIFDLYQVFQGAVDLPLEVHAPRYEFGTVSVPGVQGSAARGADGVVHLGLVNLDPHHPASLQVDIVGLRARTVLGRVLTAAAMDAHNSFQQPEEVRPVEFTAARLEGAGLKLTLPAKSVVVLDLQ